VRSSSDSIALQADITSSSRQREQQAADALQLLAVHAPGPPVSCAYLTPADLLTPNLIQLNKTCEKNFKPQSTLRELEPLERGYWIADCSGWQSDLWELTWLGLHNYIQARKAGWGVWCSRDPDFKWLRLYSWGCLAKHTYLVLYVTTMRRISNTKTHWVDGQGKTCIVMEVKEK
jgi:hypothetical protein